MLKAQTKLTLQGQVFVPAAFRQALRLMPGSMLEWVQKGNSVVVKRAVRSSTDDIHHALFDDAAPVAPVKTLTELRQGIRQNILRRYARG